jgi:hypothetical protein
MPTWPQGSNLPLSLQLEQRFKPQKTFIATVQITKTDSVRDQISKIHKQCSRTLKTIVYIPKTREAIALLSVCRYCLPFCNSTMSSHLSAWLFICLYAYISTCLSDCLLSLCPPVCLTFYPYTSLSALLYFYSSANLPVYMYICLSACLPFCMSTCLPIFMSACPHVCLSVLSICLSACLPACLTVWLFVHPRDCLSACLSFFQSPYLLICLPAGFSK